MHGCYGCSQLIQAVTFLPPNWMSFRNHVYVLYNWHENAGTSIQSRGIQFFGCIYDGIVLFGQSVKVKPTKSVEFYMDVPDWKEVDGSTVIGSMGYFTYL